MELYVANCTKQNHDFAYRIKGQRVVTRPITAGAQIRIANLEQHEVDQIVKQHVVFGMLPVVEAVKNKKFIGRAYSINTPVAMERIAETIDRNDQALTDKSTEVRTATVAATEKTLQTTAQQTNSTVKNVETEVIEQKRDASDNDKKFSQKLSTKDKNKK